MIDNESKERQRKYVRIYMKHDCTRYLYLKGFSELEEKKVM